MSSSGDVVITMLGSLGMQVASRFARSLRESGAQCQLVYLMPQTESSRSIVLALAEWRVVPHYYIPTQPPFSELKGDRAKLIRYYAALEYLRTHRSKHEMGRVLLADSRDVIFQRDPFAIAADRRFPLDVFMEDYLRDFRNSGINQGHVLPCFGSEMVRRVFLSPARPVSCSGVTLGTFAGVAAYLDAMWTEMRKPRYTPQCLQHDQAFHNMLLWTGKLAAAVGKGGVRALSNEAGPVTTIGWPQHLYRDRFGRVLNRLGDVAHIVHQYDRRKRLVSTLGARYQLLSESKVEKPPRTSAPIDTTAGLPRSNGTMRVADLQQSLRTPTVRASPSETSASREI